MRTLLAGVLGRFVMHIIRGEAQLRCGQERVLGGSMVFSMTY